MTVGVYGHLIASEDLGAANSLDNAPKRNLSATTKNKNAATPQDYGIYSNLVAMQGIEPRTLRI